MQARRPWLAILLFTGLPFSAQQTGPGLETDQQSSPPVTRARHSTKADEAVPLCPARFEDGLGRDGIADESDQSVIPPKGENVVRPQLPEELRWKYQGKEHSWEIGLRFLTDVNGKPQDICISMSAGYGLDALAAQSILKSTFDPATKDGKPVPFRSDATFHFKIL